MQKMILASGSPRRKELLEQIGIPFIVMVSGVEENSSGYTDAVQFARDMAHNKAIDIYKRYKNNVQSDGLNTHKEDNRKSLNCKNANWGNDEINRSHEIHQSEQEKDSIDYREEISFNQYCESQKHYILAADTIVVKDGHILGKPKNALDARTMLKSLSGEWHEVITGISLLSTDTGHELIETVTTRVKFRIISKELLNQYCLTNEPYDKAGSYGIQGYGSLLVERIEGDYSNVMGLPIQKVSVMLENMGIQPLSWL